MNSYLTAAAASEIAGVGISTIKRWCIDGKVKAKKFGKVWMIDEGSLRAHEKDTRGRKREGK